MSDNINYYQSIPELGIQGRMNTDEEFDRIGLPTSLYKKSLLDIGCNIGAFCIEAKKRGAKDVYGIEPNIDWRLLAKGIAKELWLDIQYFEGYTNQFIGNAKADIVLLLSVLHLVEDPQKLLDDAWNITNELLIVEINDRLQVKKLKFPKRAILYGKNKDNRSVYHFIKNNG